MELQKILNSETSFKYMLLNRIQSDCYYYISYGGGLWGITPEIHAEYMVAIWNNLKIKPEWLPKKELKELYYKLTKKELEV